MCTYVHFLFTNLKKDLKMNTDNSFNVYECFDQKGNPVKLVCDGHIDSMLFRDKCFKDFYVKPMVVRHQWQKTKKTFRKNAGKGFKKSLTETIDCGYGDTDATPITVGLLRADGF